MEWLRTLLKKATITNDILDIDSLMEIIKKVFPKYAVPKNEFNALNDTKKYLEQQIKDMDCRLKELQEKVKSNERLEITIKELQKSNKFTKDIYESKLKDIMINFALQAKLIDIKYKDLLISKFDKSKLIITEDGTVAGIDDQLKSMMVQYKDLFTPLVKGRESENKGISSKGILKEQYKVIFDNSGIQYGDKTE